MNKRNRTIRKVNQALGIKLYEFCTDEITGEKYGWARVLDYIGVEY